MTAIVQFRPIGMPKHVELAEELLAKAYHGCLALTDVAMTEVGPIPPNADLRSQSRHDE